jgi:hypothetical protein
MKGSESAIAVLPSNQEGGNGALRNGANRNMGFAPEPNRWRDGLGAFPTPVSKTVVSETATLARLTPRWVRIRQEPAPPVAPDAAACCRIRAAAALVSGRWC